MSNGPHHTTIIPSKHQLIHEIREKRKQYGISETELGEQLGMNQSQISKLLNGNRRLLYDEAHSIITYLSSRSSSIPSDIPVSEFMIPNDDLVWASPQDKIKHIANKMIETGLPQIPVKSHGEYVGIVYQTSVLHGFLFPPSNHNPETWISRYKELTIKDVNIINDVPEYPSTASLYEIFRVLITYNPVVLKEHGRMVGMISRSQLLKLAT